VDKDKLTAARSQQECIYKEKQKKRRERGTPLAIEHRITSKNIASPVSSARYVRNSHSRTRGCKKMKNAFTFWIATVVLGTVIMEMLVVMSISYWKTTVSN
jgi:hypothetical protein